MTDFLDVVDTRRLLCTCGGNKYRACGFDAEADLGAVVAMSDAWGGTSVTYQRLDFLEGAPRGLVWRYGTSDPGNTRLVPWLHGRDDEEEEFKNISEEIAYPHPLASEPVAIATSSYALAILLARHPESDRGKMESWRLFYSDQTDPDGDGRSAIDPDGDYLYWVGPLHFGVSRFPACEGPN